MNDSTKEDFQELKSKRDATVRSNERLKRGKKRLKSERDATVRRKDLQRKEQQEQHNS